MSSRNKKLEKAIEVGIERLRISLRDKEHAIQERYLELQEYEYGLKQRESDLLEFRRALEQEKRSNEYLRIVNSKAETIFNNAMKTLKNKEKQLVEGLEKICEEFNITNSINEEVSDVTSRIELIKIFIRNLVNKENETMKLLKEYKEEKFGISCGRCRCGYPMFNLGDEFIVTETYKSPNNSDSVEMEFRYMELDWERRAIEHTKESLRLQKLKQNEIIKSKEEKLLSKQEELEARLREVKRMEHLLTRRLNNGKRRFSCPNNSDLPSGDQHQGLKSNIIERRENNKQNFNNFNEQYLDSDNKSPDLLIVDPSNTFKKLSQNCEIEESELYSLTPSDNNLSPFINRRDSSIGGFSDVYIDCCSTFPINTETNFNETSKSPLSYITTPHRESYLSSARESIGSGVIPPRMSPLLKHQRRRLKELLSDTNDISSFLNEDIENISYKNNEIKESQDIE
ncbi:hypothetical protein cand_023900 [Cryptosporidium andersoni]|uniref:Uncharacterized protein n=1 Tax=Cryptosporidium andersoni TaxID=117008 RepID=A0A1J4MRW7_9CRYT|nr:hypothetical protein cand_023900 [Cryptosporidium andersoni]